MVEYLDGFTDDFRLTEEIIKYSGGDNDSLK